jgi:hypothetical protein
MFCTPSQQPVCPALSTLTLWSPETVTDQRVQQGAMIAMIVQPTVHRYMDISRSERGTVKNATGGKFNMVITDIIPLKLNTR